MNSPNTLYYTYDITKGIIDVYWQVSGKQPIHSHDHFPKAQKYGRYVFIRHTTYIIICGKKLFNIEMIFC